MRPNASSPDSTARALYLVIAALALFLTAGVAQAQTTWFVDGANCPGPGSGVEADPFCIIQDGIDASVSGDEVVIADGTYSGVGNVNLNFNGKLITVRSASGDPTQCIIDGQLVNGGFTFNTGETNEAVVDGLTITSCQFAPPSVGAAFLIQSANPTINNCILSNNFTGMDGGAIYCDFASPTITNCTFLGNFASGDGGAIYNNTSTPGISNCTFQENTAFGDGGAIYNNDTPPEISNCTFQGNTAFGDGGAIYNVTSNFLKCDAIIANCTFTGNSADFDGGGMFHAGGCTTLTNCQFNDNTAQTRGGAIFVQSGLATITGCAFTSNIALTDVGGAVAIIAPGQHTIEGCLFETNSAALAGGGIDYTPVKATGVDRLSVCNTNFAGNFTLPEFLGVGGAICNTSGTLELQTCTLDTNTATTEGGGIYTAGGSVTLTLCVLGGNFAPDLGGGIANAADDSDEGAALTLTDCQLIANQSGFLGGGIHNGLGTVSMTNCTMDQNSAYDGGGLYISPASAASLETCAFTSNTANFGGGIHNHGTVSMMSCMFSGNSADQQGGAMRNSNSSNSVVTNCAFIGNSAGIRCGGMYNEVSSPTVTNCTFSGNFAGESGGGMYNIGSSNPTVTNCTFSGNSCINGGGMYNSNSSSPTVTNCTFSGNMATNNGGGMLNLSTSPTVTNCTFSGNSASNLGGAIYNDTNGNPTVTNCILWGDSPDEIFDFNSTPAVTYGNVQGGYPGTGNIDADPLFVDADGLDNTPGTEDDNLRLSPGSPCIDAADNTAVPAGITEDLDGNPRFVDDPDTPDTGNPDFINPIVDMGAYEFQPPPPNNDPNNPQPINSGDTISGDFAYATNEGTSSCDPDSVDLFYEVTITTSSATLEVDTCGSAVDTALAVFDSSMTELGCNTDCGGKPCGAPDACLILAELPADSYLIRVSQQTTALAGGSGASFMLTVFVNDCPADCDDGDLCTDDTCDLEAGCTHKPNYDPVSECCDPATGDITPIDDNDACTDDSCDAETGQVTHTPVVCPDGEVCDPGTGKCTSDCGPCPTDANGDGETGPFDLATLLAAWGPVAPGNCLDANGDSVIGPFDLATLLAAWGPCP